MGPDRVEVIHGSMNYLEFWLKLWPVPARSLHWSRGMDYGNGDMEERDNGG